MPPPLDLTLILAATRDMGIGRAGTLPWTGLRKEMAYFARITKRLPPGAPPTARNAVVMGRKTWDSIPPAFRPLKGRLNVVVSRSPAAAGSGAAAAAEPARAASLEGALELLRAEGAGGRLGRVFVIGGAQVYGEALRLGEAARRILLTRVRSEFECDTFFSLKLGGEGEAEGGEGEERWRRVGKEELDAWAGEVVPQGVQTENGTDYEFEMWERVDRR